MVGSLSFASSTNALFFQFITATTTCVDLNFEFQSDGTAFNLNNFTVVGDGTTIFAPLLLLTSQE